MKLTDAIIVSISEMIAAGKRPHEIRAKIPGLSPGLLSSALRKLGVPNFRRGRTETPIYTALRESLSNRTESLSEIGAKYGISRQRVSQIIFNEKHRARNVTKIAIKNGKLVRPEKCQSCGIPCKPESHHEDYSKPLEVEWLCIKCHGLKTPSVERVTNGRKGGLSRARKLTRARRLEIANMGAKAAKLAGKTGGRPKKSKP